MFQFLVLYCVVLCACKTQQMVSLNILLKKKCEIMWEKEFNYAKMILINYNFYNNNNNNNNKLLISYKLA